MTKSAKETPLSSFKQKFKLFRKNVNPKMENCNEIKSLMAYHEMLIFISLKIFQVTKQRIKKTDIDSSGTDFTY